MLHPALADSPASNEVLPPFLTLMHPLTGSYDRRFCDNIRSFECVMKCIVRGQAACRPFQMDPESEYCLSNLSMFFTTICTLVVVKKFVFRGRKCTTPGFNFTQINRGKNLVWHLIYDITLSVQYSRPRTAWSNLTFRLNS